MNRIFSARLAVFLAIAVIGALMFGGVLHSVIPHTHGYAEDDHQHEQNEESALWTSLHSALRHEDKKSLLLVIAMLNTGLFAILVIAQVPQSAISVLQNARIHDPLFGEYLTRGIAKYRRFG